MWPRGPSSVRFNTDNFFTNRYPVHCFRAFNKKLGKSSMMQKFVNHVLRMHFRELLQPPPFRNARRASRAIFYGASLRSPKKKWTLMTCEWVIAKRQNLLLVRAARILRIKCTICADPACRWTLLRSRLAQAHCWSQHRIWRVLAQARALGGKIRGKKLFCFLRYPKPNFSSLSCLFMYSFLSS